MEIFQIVEILFAIIVGWTMTAFVLPRISLVSFRRRLFDSVDGRKIHSSPIPRFGGVAFFPCISTTVSLAIIGHNLWMGNNMLDLNLTNRLLSICCSMFLLYLVGIMDDLVGVRYPSKFLVQIICGSLLVASGLCFDNLYGLFGIYALPLYIGIPLTIFAIVFILNAINLIDGIDGLASGLSIIAFFIFGCMSARLHWWMYTFVCFASFGVLLPFFYRNVFGSAEHGRKLFMGDTGSLTIGLLLAVMVIRLSMYDAVKESVFPCAIIVALSLLIVPLFDVVRVVIHRLRLGKNPFLPDKNHIHHKFISLGLSQHRAMVVIIGINITFAAANIALVHYISITTLFLFDVAAWTVMHICLTAEINRRNKLKETNCTENKK